MSVREHLAAAIWDKWAIGLFGYNRRYADLQPEERVRVLAVVDVIDGMLRDPTTAMLLAACAEAKKEQLRPLNIHRTDAAMIWQAMLSEALK